METLKVILNILVLIWFPVVMSFIAIRERKHRKEMNRITKEFNDMITEAKVVRDEIQSLFGEFEEKLDSENETEQKITMGIIRENWNEPDGDEIDVPDELMPLVNKVNMQIKMMTLTGKNEIQTICDIVEISRNFLSAHKELLD